MSELSRGADEHGEILAALRDRNPGAASRAMATHIAATLSNIRTLHDRSP